jgi:hypothetical protein
LYVQSSSVEIHTPAHCNLIGHSLTALPLVLSPSSNVPPLLSYYAFVSARKNSAGVSKIFHPPTYLEIA